MIEEDEILDPDYGNLLISIIAYTRGRWCVDDVVSMYEFILDEIELQNRPQKPDLKVIEMKRDDHDGSGD